MTQLYQTPLPESQANTSDEGVRAQIQQSGLLEEGGIATEKIASEDIDLVIEGEIELGELFSVKVAREIESIGESDYSGLPLYTIGASNGGRNAGYYEVESVDVSPAHPVTGESYSYTMGLKSSGTREDEWSAVKTSVEEVDTGLATEDTPAPLGLPSEASKVRWFGESSGKENASVDSTVSAEFGDVDLYALSDTSITNPMLLYELPYSESGDVDVRVYDDHDRDKTYSVSSGGTTVEASQWTHAYHTSFEFEGRPVVDNGLLRVRFDEGNSVVEAYEWNNTGSTWDEITVSMGEYELVDADFEKISPSDVRVFTEWYQTVDDRLEQATLSIQRGLGGAIARYPDGTTQTSGLESVLDPFVADYDSDTKPSQTLKSRSEVK